MVTRDDKTLLVVVGVGLVLFAGLLLGGAGFVYFFLYRPFSPGAEAAFTTTAVKVPDPVIEEALGLDAIVVQVKAAPDGNIDEIVIRSADSVSLVSDLDNLTRSLTKLRPDVNGQAEIKLEVAAGLTPARVEEVRDACVRAGFRRPSLPPAVGGEKR